MTQLRINTYAHVLGADMLMDSAFLTVKDSACYGILML